MQYARRRSYSTSWPVLSKPRTARAIPQGNAHRALDLVFKEHVDGILSLQRQKHKWHWGVSRPVGWAEGANKPGGGSAGRRGEPEAHSLLSGRTAEGLTMRQALSTV